MAKCKKLGIVLDLNDHYVDAEIVVIREIGNGWFCNKNLDKMKYSAMKENEGNEIFDT